MINMDKLKDELFMFIEKLKEIARLEDKIQEIKLTIEYFKKNVHNTNKDTIVSDLNKQIETYENNIKIIRKSLLSMDSLMSEIDKFKNVISKNTYFSKIKNFACDIINDINKDDNCKNCESTMDKINELEIKLNEIELESKNIIKENNSLKHKNMVLSDANKLGDVALLKRYNDLENNNSLLSHGLNNLRNEYNNIEKKYKLLEHNNIDITNKYEMLKNKFCDTDKKYCDIQNEHDLLKTEYKKLINIKNNNNDITSKYEMLKNKFCDTDKKYCDIQNEHELLKTEYKKLIKIKNDNNDITSKYEMLKNKFCDTDKKYCDIQNEHELLKTEFDKLNNIKNNLETNLTAIKMHCSQLQQNNFMGLYEQLNIEHQDIKKKHKILVDENHFLKNENNVLVNDIENKNAKICELNDELKKLKNNNGNLVELLNNLNLKINDTKPKIINKQNQYEPINISLSNIYEIELNQDSLILYNFENVIGHINNTNIELLENSVKCVEDLSFNSPSYIFVIDNDTINLDILKNKLNELNVDHIFGIISLKSDNFDEYIKNLKEKHSAKNIYYVNSI
jgi:chromosome segregation ATPase